MLVYDVVNRGNKLAQSAFIGGGVGQRSRGDVSGIVVPPPGKFGHELFAAEPSESVSVQFTPPANVPAMSGATGTVSPDAGTRAA